jgi:hypothetical protein
VAGQNFFTFLKVRSASLHVPGQRGAFRFSSLLLFVAPLLLPVSNLYFLRDVSTGKKCGLHK